jgi:dienelactone hydrolase
MAAIQCRDCISGSVHAGKPVGNEITFHGLPTYVTRPDEGTPEKGIIVFIHDIFGWKFANSRLLADKYAKKGGYIVYLPDFMRGESINHLSSQIFTLYP